MAYQQLILAHSYLSDQAMIVATSEQGTMPATNLLRSPYPSTANSWRSLGGARTIKLTIHLPEIDGLLWDLVTPLFTNSSIDGTWQIIAAPTEAGLDSGPTFVDDVRSLWPAPNMMAPGEPEWRHALRWLKGNPRTEPWLQLIVDDPSPVVSDDVLSPFVQWGRLYVALAWQPSYHHDRGAEMTPSNERGRRVVTQGGGDRTGSAARPRTFKFNVGFLTRDEMLTKGWELDRLVGTSGDLLVIEAPEDPLYVHKGMIYGTLPDVVAQVEQEYDIHSRTYTIQERIS